MAQTERLDSLLDHEPLAIGDLILTEALQGFANERDFSKATENADFAGGGRVGRTRNRDSSGEKFPGAATHLGLRVVA
jgi:hypothetical protein